MSRMAGRIAIAVWLCVCAAVICLAASLSAAGEDQPQPGAAPAAKTLHLCCPEEQWYPFLYTEEAASKGMLLDIAKRACEKAGYTVVIETYPLNRCLRMMEFGKADGMIGLPYDRKYATAVEYPQGSPGAVESVWRLLQVDEVVITYKGGEYEYGGNIRSLPGPVRVVHGSAAAGELKQAGIDFEEVETQRQLFSKLIRDKKGCIITNTIAAELYEKDEAFRGLFDIHAVPLRSSSYYLVFSWQSGLGKDERENLWREVRRARQDYIFMMRVYSQY